MSIETVISIIAVAISLASLFYSVITGRKSSESLKVQKITDIRTSLIQAILITENKIHRISNLKLLVKKASSLHDMNEVNIKIENAIAPHADCLERLENIKVELDEIVASMHLNPSKLPSDKRISELEYSVNIVENAMKSEFHTKMIDDIEKMLID